MALFSLFAGDSGETSHRLRVIEKKLDMIMESLGLEYADSALDEVAALARGGRKIEAIKRYRELTGVGLKDAKDAVDSIR
jgi:ribosomal protein L7/L12